MADGPKRAAPRRYQRGGRGYDACLHWQPFAPIRERLSYPASGQRRYDSPTMLNTPFSVWPSFSDEEVQAVAETVRSNKVNYWTGQEARHFEREFAEWVGVPYAIALGVAQVTVGVALATTKDTVLVAVL